LGHDKFDILVFETISIDLLCIIFIIILLVITSLNGLTLAMVVMIVSRVIMSCVVMRFLGSQLLSSRSLCLGVKILNLSLSENTVSYLVWFIVAKTGSFLHVGVACWRLENLWVVDDEQDLRERMELARSSRQFVLL
jgi:hypothetical protein